LIFLHSDTTLSLDDIDNNIKGQYNMIFRMSYHSALLSSSRNNRGYNHKSNFIMIIQDERIHNLSDKHNTVKISANSAWHMSYHAFFFSAIYVLFVTLYNPVFYLAFIPVVLVDYAFKMEIGIFGIFKCKSDWDFFQPHFYRCVPLFSFILYIKNRLKNSRNVTNL
jgi:hypothetical protein